MRVGAYVDGLNVYYGGRHLCGRDAPGWRWFDLAVSVERNDGVSGHWWYRLTAEDFFDNQLPEVVGGARKPADW